MTSYGDSRIVENVDAHYEVIDLTSHPSRAKRIPAERFPTNQMSEIMSSTHLNEPVPAPQPNRTWDKSMNDNSTVDGHLYQHLNPDIANSEDTNARELGICSKSVGNSSLQPPFDLPHSTTEQYHGQSNQSATLTTPQERTSCFPNDESHLQNDLSSHVDDSSSQSRNYILRSLARASLFHAQEELADDSNETTQMIPASNNIRETEIITPPFNNLSPFNRGSNDSNLRSGDQNHENATSYHPASTYGQTFRTQESSTWANKEPLGRPPPPIFTNGSFQLHPHFPSGHHPGNIGASPFSEAISSSYQDSPGQVIRPGRQIGFEPMRGTTQFIQDVLHPTANPNSHPCANSPLTRLNSDEAQPTQDNGFPVFTIPVNLWKMIDSNKNRYPDAPGSNCFRNDQGAFICPLCPRGVEYSGAAGFKQHLDTHQI